MRTVITIIILLSFSTVSFAQIAPISGIPGICAGSSSAFTDVTSGGVWSTSNSAIATVGSASGSVAGVAAGSATITYTVGGSYVTYALSVNPLPNIYPVSGGGSYCSGGTGINITLGGSDAGVTYQLYSGGVAIGGALAGTGSPIVLGLETGSGTYTVVATNTTTGCTATMSGSATVAINPLPTAYTVTGGGTRCLGGAGVPVGLNGSAAGTSYQLYIGLTPVGSPIAGTGAALNFGLQTIPGIYSVTAVNTATGCAANMSGTAVISISGGPVISGLTSLCVGGAIYPTASPSGGTWTSSNPAVASVGADISGVSPGTAIITYVLGTGCYTTDTITVNAWPSPIIGGNNVCDGSTLTLTTSPGGGAWSSAAPSVATVGSTTGIVTGVAVGATTISYSIGTGCISTLTVTVQSSTCFGTPTGGTATAASPTIAPGLTEILGLSGASLSCAVAMQWQSSTDGITYTNITGATAASYSYTAAATLYYRCKLTCITTGLYAYSTPVLVTVRSSIAAHSMPTDTTCAGQDFYIAATGVSSAYYVTTWFGDGTAASAALTSTGTCYANVVHAYSTPGAYTVKQVLYYDSVAQDSISFSYTYTHCYSFPISFYIDANSDCMYDTGDYMMWQPEATEIDSAGVPVDTISATSGFYYIATGPVGTVYTFKVVSLPAGIIAACSSPGVIYDTIQSSLSLYPVKYMALKCDTGSGVTVTTTIDVGRHIQYGYIAVASSYCVPSGVVVEVFHDPYYAYSYSYAYGYYGYLALASTTVDSSSITWVDTNTTLPTTIYYELSVGTSPWRPPGTTETNTVVVLNAATLDTINVTTITDTVNSSFDPNEMTVSPAGLVLPCTTLQYGIAFQNTGNDTAHNITVMDTLPTTLDISSLTIKAASATMNTTIVKGVAYNVVEFNFPNINLLDTAHSATNTTGTVSFTIKVKSGLTDGTAIYNHAGVFFDDNPAVLTDTVGNTIGIWPIAGNSTLCIATHDTLTNISAGGVWSVSNAHASIAAGVVAGLSAGTDTVSYTTSNTCASRTTTKVVTINAAPVTGAISGAASVCAGAMTLLTDTTRGGTWRSSNALLAGIDSLGNMVTISAGVDTISYSHTGICGTAAATKAVTINPQPSAIGGSAAVCAGATATLTNTVSGGVWSCGLPGIAAIGSLTGIVTGISTGTPTVTYSLPTGCYSTTVITVNPMPAAITGLTAVCQYADVTLADATTGGAWSSGSTSLATINPATGVATGVGAGSLHITYTLPAGCFTAYALTVNSAPSAIGGSAPLCAGATAALTNTVTGGAWSSSNTLMATIGSATGTVLGISTGTPAITYALPDGCYSTTTITVNPLPDGITGLTDVCETADITLSDGTGGGAWSSSNTSLATVNSSTGVATGVAAGALHVTYTLPTGCLTAYALTVNAQPAAISGSTSICAGSAASLADATAGGAWSSSDVALATIGTGSGTVTGISAGTPILSYTLPTGCYSTAVVTVNALPAAYSVTGGGSYCAGDTGVHVDLAGSATGILYVLHRDATTLGSFSGTGAAIDLGLQTSPGTYYVTASNTATTCHSAMPDSVTISITPTVIPAVSITATPGDTVCAGTAVTFIAISINGGTTPAYQWQVNGAAVTAIGNSYTYIPAGGDRVSTVLTSNAACATPREANSSLTMGIVTPVAASMSLTETPTYIQPGDTVTLTATVTGSVTPPTYQWVLNGYYIPGATNSTYTNDIFMYGDSVACLALAGNICGDTMVAQSFVVRFSTGIPVVNAADKITIMPNPAHSILTIAYNLTNPQDATFQLTDVTGRIVLTTTLYAQQQQQHADVSNLAPGLYLYRVLQNDMLISEGKVIRQ